MSKFKFNHRQSKPIGIHVQQHGNYVTVTRAKERPSLRLHQNGMAIPDSSDRLINPSKGSSGRGRGWHFCPPIAGARRFVVETVSRAGLHKPIVRTEEEYEYDNEKRLANIVSDLEAELTQRELEYARYDGAVIQS